MKYLKYLIWLLPLAVVWLSFYIGFALALTPAMWYTFPFACTVILIFCVSVVFAINIIEKY